jgi:uncharacterized protein YggU (UPF0235/DUF167 family)
VSSDSLLRPAGTGRWRLSVKLTPKAAANKIQGIAWDEHGAALLKVSVTAVPENGKANAALLALLAKQCKLPKSALQIESGATDRRKTLLIAGDEAELAARLCPEGKTAP